MGYMRDGKWINGTPYFAFRQMYQRIYTLMKQLDPENVIIHHVSGRLNGPVVAYADIYFSGERNWEPKDGVLLGDSYLDRIGLDEFRAEFMGHQYGVIGWFLPQFRHATLRPEQWCKVPGLSGNRPTKDICDELVGIGLLHDLYIDPRGGINPEATIPVFKVQDEFGHRDAKFFGYWNNADLISGQTEAIKASAYRKPEGGALVVVFNTTRRLQRPTLQIDWDRLKSKQGLSVADAFTKDPISVEGQSVTTELKPLNYRLLWVK